MSRKQSAVREAQLAKVFAGVLDGSVPLQKRNSVQFLEAISAAGDAATCVQKIRASPNGLEALGAAMRMNVSFVLSKGLAKGVLQYLATPGLAAADDGQLLRPILMAIVQPPDFWNVFLDEFVGGKLDEDMQICFAWLLSQLVVLPGNACQPYRFLAERLDVTSRLYASSDEEMKVLTQKIRDIIDSSRRGVAIERVNGPGGRHDNDHSNFHLINIMPTAQELACNKQAFLRRSNMLDDAEMKSTRVNTHIDNQFRLLREDMLSEMREELQIARGLKKGKHRGFILEGFTIEDLYLSEDGNEHVDKRRKKYCKWGLVLKSKSNFPRWKNMQPKDRKKDLEKNKNFMRDQSMVCILFNNEVVAFSSLRRVDSLLVQDPPTVILQIEDPTGAKKVLSRLRNHGEIKLIQVETAVFAYEPILSALKSQNEESLLLSRELLLWEKGEHIEEPEGAPRLIVSSVRWDPGQNLQSLLRLPKPVILDTAQVDAFLAGLTQRVSLIQGPPGTGKSFIGALLAKALHDFGEETILVVCYTNHALDQFLEDLLDIGIPRDDIVRLGGKSTDRTAEFTLRALRQNGPRAILDYKSLDLLNTRVESLADQLQKRFEQYQAFNSRFEDILDHLEFQHTEYFEAFEVPTSDDSDGMQVVGSKGRAVDREYLLRRWVQGQDAGIFRKADNVRNASQIWRMPRDRRDAELGIWRSEMLNDVVDYLLTAANDYNATYTERQRIFGDRDAGIIKSKRIIGCTTTGAAMFRREIEAVAPGVLLVEEAGEVLESHILTALGSSGKQLILIGDHKQLRPKVSNYMLTVEKGEGFDLNRSLFERLVLKGFPHATLHAQHRMRPEISTFVRELTYPDLKDAPKTANRPNLRGVQNNIVLIDHGIPEDDDKRISDRGDIGAKASKANKHESDMIVRIVRYIRQQGYSTDNMVVLTPYLGQLRQLQDALNDDFDPYFNDLDAAELGRAGLLLNATGQKSKKRLRLRISTIDNYQGEESDIVIASLTRSNSSGDIGFMSSPERLTVLLSRARNAFVLIGNTHTFRNARKGSDMWRKFFDMAKRNGHVYDGLPIFCERHPSRKELLKTPDDFKKKAPDGGCNEPCNILLKCGVHSCPKKCHDGDHSNVSCITVVTSKCAQGHPKKWKCSDGEPDKCKQCEHERKLADQKMLEEYERQQRRDAEQREHEQKMAEIDAQIQRQLDALQEEKLGQDRKAALTQKLQELKEATARRELGPTNHQSTSSASASSPAPSASARAQAGQGPTPTPGNQTNPASTPTPTPVNPTNSPSIPTTASPSQPAGTAPVNHSPKPMTLAASQAVQDWQHQKTVLGQTNVAIDRLMAMVGLEEVKSQVLKIKNKVDTTKKQGASLKDERFNVSMLGNPGTGKTTVARLYGQFLASVGVIPGSTFVETTGAKLANDGVSECEKLLKGMIGNGGGTLFIDEAYHLTSPAHPHGKAVLDFLLPEIENLVGTIVFVFAGYDKEMESFFEHNPGLPSRVPYSLSFKDYKDPELISILEGLILKTWNGGMKVEDDGTGEGIRGLYGRIAVRRLGRGRGTKGFGNARALANMFARIRERQAARLTKECNGGLNPDYFLITKEDLIGPKPSKAMTDSEAWRKLDGMIGLKAVKQSVQQLAHIVTRNYERELKELEPHQISLNKVFLGNPGTGKTTVAKYYGQILCDLSLLSNGKEVVVKNPSDFIGAYIGHSEKQTKDILASSIGKVLVIDEAYSFYNKSSGHGTDSFKTGAIDTIVAEVQNVPGEDRCILLLGYKEPMEEMFDNVNPGLKRRFDSENPFVFEDYDDAELLQALEMKLKQQDLTATDAAKKVAIEVLSRARNRANFGNIGDVENLLSTAKKRLPGAIDRPFEPQDFDPDYKRHETADTNLVKLFEDVVGCDEVVKKLRTWQEMCKNMKRLGKDPRDHVPTTFVFKGPPGTGKTTTARKMGQVFYDMGFLAKAEVEECSASDLVGQYVGHTGPKTQQMFEKALGRVLFIDEAYRLGSGRFAQEAMDEMVALLTQDKYRGKMLVILAGYDNDMNNLMQVNSGLSSRFTESIYFKNITPKQCLTILKSKLSKESVTLDVLDQETSPEYDYMITLIQELSSLPSWGNARDVETLAKKMIAIVFSSSSPSGKLSPQEAIGCIKDMLSERRARAGGLPRRSPSPPPFLPMQSMGPGPASAPPGGSTSSSSNQAPPPPPSPPARTPTPPPARTPTPPPARTPTPPPARTPTPPSARASAPPPARAPAPPPPPSPAQSNRRRPPAQNPPPQRPRHSSQRPSQIQPTATANSTPPTTSRDPNVPDAVWDQLQRNIQAAEAAKQQALAEKRELQKKAYAAEQREKAARLKAEKLAREQAAAAELKRVQDELKKKEREAAEARRKREEARKAEEQRKQREQRIQTKIRNLGVCPQGYIWYKWPGGYRCTGGAHFLTDAQIGI